MLVTQNASTRKNPQFVLLKIYWTRKMKSEVYGICQTSNEKIKKRRERRK
jgi:RNA polymerase-binding transcription factor DksA